MKWRSVKIRTKICTTKINKYINKSEKKRKEKSSEKSKKNPFNFHRRHENMTQALPPVSNSFLLLLDIFSGFSLAFPDVYNSDKKCINSYRIFFGIRTTCI